MSIPDLAEAMAPGMPHEVVGTRPGEKVHEVMITNDDARATLELDDRYVITPTYIHGAVEDFTVNGAKPVAEDFVYASNTNGEWLDAEGLGHLMKNGTP